ncbi:hypothetical protein D3C87_1822190 [compost metagenome]
MCAGVHQIATKGVFDLIRIVIQVVYQLKYIIGETLLCKTVPAQLNVCGQGTAIDGGTHIFYHCPGNVCRRKLVTGTAQLVGI